MDKRNIMYITISIICVISIILGVYYQIFADKVVNENDVNEIENTVGDTDADNPNDLIDEFNALFNNSFNAQGYPTNQITKIAGLEHKAIIYPHYDIEKEEEGKYSMDIELPVFNVAGDIPAQFNSITQSVFANKASTILTTGTKYTIYNVEYVAYLNESILSLVIKATLKEGNSAQRTIVQAYNYDILSKTKVTLDDVLEDREINKKDVNKKIDVQVKEAARQAQLISEATGQVVYKRDLSNAMYLTENVTNFFLGEDGQIYIIYAYGNNNITSEIDIIKL